MRKEKKESRKIRLTAGKGQDEAVNLFPVDFDGKLAFLTYIPVPDGHSSFGIVTDGIERPSDKNALPMLKVARGHLSVLFLYEDNERPS